MSEFYIDEFITTKAGEPYRLLPFGTIYKGGKKREITPEYASKFRLPHFKPPIKLGSHEETTPAGGHIMSLEVRGDGLYVVPEYLETGEKAVTEGSYRYHSPEIVFEGGFEDPTTGKKIEGPLIIGDALLHMPHLGEATAFYKSEIQEDKPMTEQVKNESVPLSVFDKFLELFQAKDKKQESEQPQKDEVQQPENFEAIVSERDEYKAKIEAYEAEQKRKESIMELAAKLQDKEAYGAMYVELQAANEAAEILSTMTPEQQGWVLKNFSALIAQAGDVEEELGSAADTKGVSGEQAIDAAIRAKMATDNIGYVAAFEAVRDTKPELFKVKEE